jgi:hypothetical protein
VRNVVSGFQRFGRGDYLYSSSGSTGASDSDIDGAVGDGYDEVGRCDLHHHATAANRRGGNTDDGLGTDEQDTKHQRDGEQRLTEQGRNVGADWRGLLGRNVRDVVSGFQRFGHSDYLYSSSGSTGASDGDTDGEIPNRYDEVSRCDVHHHATAADRRSRKSNNSDGADEQDAKHHRDSEQ